MFAYFTLIAYLVVGSVAVRFMTAETRTISFSNNYFNLLTTTGIKSTEFAPISVVAHTFAEVDLPKVETAKRVAIVNKIAKKTGQPPALEYVKVAGKYELPFHEPFRLNKVSFNGSLRGNLLALFVPVSEETKEMLAEAPAMIADEVSTQVAKNDVVEEEPVFFEYPTEEIETPKKETLTINVADSKESETAEVPTKVVEKAVANVVEEVSINDYIAFDYSASKQDISEKKMPTVTKATTHKKKAQVISKSTSSEPLVAEPKQEEGFMGLMAGYPSELTIQVSGTNLKNTEKLSNYEMRFQDDLAEIVEDYGNGSITLSQQLAEEAMTRSVSILKRGYTPTNTDLILEKGAAAYSVPLIEEAVFNELIAPYEAKGTVGALLVELDDETEIAQIDVPFGKVIQLNGDLKVTEKDEYRYLLFLGVKSGNALLSYKDFDGSITKKILHIHDRELTFEANFYEKVKTQTVALYEEGLLGKEKAPLIIAADQVKLFASEKSSKKVNDHTYKIAAEKSLLAGRKYLELTHQEEPVFVGVRGNTTTSIPSESFMRYVLSRLEGSELGNRCLIQINLSKQALGVDVGSESVGSSLMTYTQVLDEDGKFYDSIGTKSRKVIIVGENQGSEDISKDAKINIKLTYQDGSVQYLGSYCSPNSYLVEQL